MNPVVGDQAMSVMVICLSISRLHQGPLFDFHSLNRSKCVSGSHHAKLLRAREDSILFALCGLI